MNELLKKYFGYDEFRPLQEDIIKNVLEKNDTLVLMPTGSGKSLCYQLPAIYFPGLTLIISPLISLMKDQVDSLNLNGIPATFINSSLSGIEIEKIKSEIEKSTIKILYIAPERLAQTYFQDFLKKLNISLIAIDEAHCISEWGHDFRPNYRNLKKLKSDFPNTPIIALTATAIEQVKEDIIKQLDLKNPKIFITSFDRKNLSFMILKKRDVFKKITHYIEKYKNESVIIYCFSRKNTEKLADQLMASGYNALPYHAGLDKDVRRNTQDKFIKDEVQIIVATIAFGMGIDKSNIRLIIHQTFPKSIEGYYQEVGRAGRDGLPAECVMLYGYFDKYKHEFFINQIEDPVIKNTKTIKMEQVINYCEKQTCRRKYLLNYFGESYNEKNCNGCDNCVPEKRESYYSEKFFINKHLNKMLRSDLQYDTKLFEKLRHLRKKIADENNVPPYIVFSDISIQEMAYYFPTGKEDFLNIQGIGQKKLEKFGDNFMEVIKNHIQENNIDSKKIPNRWERRLKRIKKEADIKGSKYNITKNLIINKIPLDEIADKQGVKKGTIIRHIEKLISSGHQISIDYLKPPQNKYKEIISAIMEYGDNKLKPVFEALNEKYSYEDIRIVKILYEIKGMVKTIDF